MGIFETISIALNALLGGGMLFQFFTIKAQRNKATAEADGAKATAESTELDNVETAIRIWREMAVQLRDELSEQRSKYTEVMAHVDALRKEVRRLTEASNKILKLLDRITPENLDKMKQEIKDEINRNEGN